MSEPSVEQLRAQLRERGYLSHGIERWFALDPFAFGTASRTFWVELLTVALKAAVLIAAFAALPMTAVMLLRNYPLHAFETFGLFAVYAAAWLGVAFVFVVVIALILKLRPELAVDTPRALLAISMAAATGLTGILALWWYRFDAPFTTPELAAGFGLTLIFFVVATLVVSAALLSFSIYELHRIPAIHQKPRGLPMSIAAAVLLGLLFVPAWAAREGNVTTPMVVTTPTTRRLALVAVDGLTHELFQSRPELVRTFVSAHPAPPVDGESTAERWASVGTGVRTEAHRVRAIAGVRFAGGRHILQRLSRSDVILQDVAPLLGIVRREPLPPTVRRRDYVWEIFARYGIPSVAVNWWTSEDQSAIFNEARGNALQVDAIAVRRAEAALAGSPRFLTVYLPALDVILNRLELDRSAQLAMSVRALDGVASTVAMLRARGYDVLLTGLPGEGQQGHAIIAATLPLAVPATPYDVAPTIAGLMGFPLSTEMPGKSLAGTPADARIVSYGNRTQTTPASTANEEYYENLRSLGYIR
ncbi:MAG TPA: hypothetical protein VGF69_03035 [Thermoanaerobaculia bacterium]